MNNLYLTKQGQSINLDSADNCMIALSDRIQSYTHTDNLVQNFNQDAQAIGIFEKMYEYRLPEVIKRTRPNTDTDLLIPTRISDWYGIESVKTTYMDTVGQVTRGRSDDDVNRVTVKYREETIKFTTSKLALKIDRDTMESNLRMLQNNIYEGINLIDDTIQETYQLFDEDYHHLSLFGDSQYNIEGLLTHSGMPDEIVTTFNPYGATRKDKFNWLIDLVSVHQLNTKGYGKIDTMLMSKRFQRELMKITDESSPNLTAYQLAVENLREMGIFNIVAIPELDAENLVDEGVFANGDDTELLLLYGRDAMCLERYVSQRRELDMSKHSYEYEMLIERRTSTINLKKPLECLKVIYPSVPD